jgi:hypothetical protein
MDELERGFSPARQRRIKPEGLSFFIRNSKRGSL